MQADFEEHAVLEVLRPAVQRVPFVFSSPHSGRDYPARFLALTQLDPWQVRRSEDCLVDALFDGVVALGAPLLKACFPRAYVDVNREASELDPAMFSGPLGLPANAGSPRVAAGLGAIPRVVGEGRPIYSGRLDPEDARMRLASCHAPYHAALQALVDETCAAFGFCAVIDCHSMPGQIAHPEDGSHPHFIVGDRFGQSASAAFSGAAIGLLRQSGYEVSHNRPYAGGFITEHYGRPADGVHALQLEVSRRLYLDEARYLPSAGFARLQTDITSFCARLMSLPDAVFHPAVTRFAAE